MSRVTVIQIEITSTFILSLAVSRMQKRFTRFGFEPVPTTA
jgi:hypothetical protein